MSSLEELVETLSSWALLDVERETNESSDLSSPLDLSSWSLGKKHVYYGYRDHELVRPGVALDVSSNNDDGCNRYAEYAADPYRFMADLYQEFITHLTNYFGYNDDYDSSSDSY